MRQALSVVLAMARALPLGVLKEGAVSNTSTFKDQTNKMIKEISASSVIDLKEQIMVKLELGRSTKYHLISSTIRLPPLEVMVSIFFGIKIQSPSTNLLQKQPLL
jgi:hypothetical protein